MYFLFFFLKPSLDGIKLKNAFTSFETRMYELRAESLNAAQILPLTDSIHCEVRSLLKLRSNQITV